MSCSASRIERLRTRLRELGAAAMYVRQTPNIEWLTAFRDVFDEEQAHALFVAAEDAVWEGRTHLHTDSRYVTACEREAEGTPIEIHVENVRFGDWAAAEWKSMMRETFGSTGDPAGLSAVSSGAMTESKLAIEDAISLSEYRALEKAFGVAQEDEDAEDTYAGFASAPFLETDGLILGLRAVKDATEIERLKAAQAVTDAAFAHIVGFIKPGMTEREVQLELDEFMLRNGAEGLAFPTIIASGANGASPHAIVSNKPLEAGECIVMDFGARRAGYDSDMTRTVFLGKPEGDVLAAWEAMRAANETVEAMLRPGVTGKEAHELALKVLAEGGFEGRMGHGLGHGVGIQIHEEPVLSPRNEQPLVAGNVVTVEPGIYIPDRFGMRLEDFGVITESGFDVFTQSTHEMIVL